MRFIARELAAAIRRSLRGSFEYDDPETEVLTLPGVAVAIPARVILYNDDDHTFDEVAMQLTIATGCSVHEGEDLAVEVDQRGLACVYEGELTDCLRVTSVLEEIALHTEIKF